MIVSYWKKYRKKGNIVFNINPHIFVFRTLRFKLKERVGAKLMLKLLKIGGGDATRPSQGMAARKNFPETRLKNKDWSVIGLAVE